MTNWTYNNQAVTDEIIPEKAYGFIYQITNMLSGKSYIGRKYLSKASSRQVKGKKRKTRVKSDWETYWSSSPDLIADITLQGKDNFKREILLWAFSRGECNYLEEKMLYQLEVLERDDFYNSNIRARIFKKHVFNYPSSLSSKVSSSSSNADPQNGQN